MKKIIKGIAITTLLVAVAIMTGVLTTQAQIGGGISVPSFFKRDGNNILFQNPLWELGSSTIRLAKVWTSVLDSTEAQIGTLTISSLATSPLIVGGTATTTIYGTIETSTFGGAVSATNFVGSGLGLTGLVPYTGATADVDLGSYGLGASILTADTMINTGGGFYAYTDGGFAFYSDAGITLTGNLIVTAGGQYSFLNPVTSKNAILDTSLITTADKTFTFPDASGTFIIADSVTGNVGIGTSTPAYSLQVWKTASSTVAIGGSGKSGCLVMGNSDGSAGLNYITVLNGTISATTTKPIICQ